jgi:hypothetical protein
MSHRKEGETYCHLRRSNQGEARSEKRTRQCALHPTTTTLPSPRLPPTVTSLRLHLQYLPPSPLIYAWNFAGETTAFGRSDIVSSWPWTADISLSHGLVFPDCHSLGGSRACHAPCTWGVPAGWSMTHHPPRRNSHAPHLPKRHCCFRHLDRICTFGEN